MTSLEPINAGSVADLAYRRLRQLIEAGTFAPSARLSQGELAAAFEVSRTTVREALHRLTADDLVEFKANRGFFVASFRLDAVLARLELRLILEPGIARLAAARRSEQDVDELAEIVRTQRDARVATVAHDRSREFHLRLARATRNGQFVRILDSLWSPEIGRQLIRRRIEVAGWQQADAAEHRHILDAVAARDEEQASERMKAHVAATLEHWSRAATAAEKEDLR